MTGLSPIVTDVTRSVPGARAIMAPSGAMWRRSTERLPMFSHRTLSRRAGALLAGAVSISLALAGCAGKTTSSGDGSDDGPITIACGAMEDLCKAWTDQFTAKTGIQATYVRLSSGEAVARLASAKDLSLIHISEPTRH